MTVADDIVERRQLERRVQELESEVRSLEAELEGYREQEAEAAQAAAFEQKLTNIIDVLFPAYSSVSVRFGHIEKPPIHPQKDWWWNGAVIEEHWSTSGGEKVRLKSYTGRDEYDHFEMEIPQVWIDAKEWQNLVLDWIKKETTTRAAVAKRKEISDAKRALKEATEKLDRLS